MFEHRQGPARLIDVAKKAGVSLTTASFAMSGRPGVSEAVADRVRVIAAELGYVPNMQARSLASGASSMLGLVVHDVADPYFAEMASAIVTDAAEVGLMVEIAQSSRKPDQELNQVRALAASRVRGIIMAGSGGLAGDSGKAIYQELQRFQSTGGRAVMIGRHRAPLDAVMPANQDGGRQVGAHVVELGHRHVGVVAGPEGLASAADRLRGVIDALEEHRDVDYVVRHSAFTHAGGKEAATSLLRDHPETTALVALNDLMAAGIVAAVREHGIRIPEDITVTGFDDVAFAADLGPGLTTAHLPLREMGAIAVQLALKKPAARPRRVPVAAELIVRGSSGPARA